MKDKNVFITGASGFIGSALARRLVADGANVVCLTKNAGKSQRLLPSSATIVTGNICDYDLMCDVISSHEIEYVFHLAANAIVKTSARDPMSTYRTNVMGTVSLLEAVKNVGRPKKVVVASSDKAYGDHDVLPYTESMALQPKNTYDTSKACADLIARTYAHNYDMPIVVTRCSNVYGPGDPNMSRIIPNSINRIARGEPPMLYSDVSEMEREFIYIDDVVSACISLAKSDMKSDGHAYNVGGTGVFSVVSIVEKILKIMGSDLKTTIVQRETIFKEIARQYIDASKLNAVTGWEPLVGIEEGLKHTINWYCNEI